MTKPRIFISSTFYDLRQVRANIESFIKNIGYEPVLHERGSIAYGRGEALEIYCYKEIEDCDILVSIIGGRYGTQSEFSQNSITQNELKRALEDQKQVYIFIERNVFAEYRTYLKNKTNPETQYHFVDNPKVYEFIEGIHNLPNNNTIFGFETSEEIVDFLRLQWAGLFQRLLNEESENAENRAIDRLNATVGSLNDILNNLMNVNKDTVSIKAILTGTHPAFFRLQELLKIRYRIFFTNYDELSSFLRAKGYRPVSDESSTDPNYHEWNRRLIFANKLDTTRLKISKELFSEDGKLKEIDSIRWSPDLIVLVKLTEIENDELEIKSKK